MPRPPAPCGTNSAYLRHRRRGEPVDEACLEAHRRTITELRRRRGVKPRVRGPEHGTRAAYQREWLRWRSGEGPPPCEECRAANAEATRRYRARS